MLDWCRGRLCGNSRAGPDGDDGYCEGECQSDGTCCPTSSGIVLCGSGTTCVRDYDNAESICCAPQRPVLMSSMRPKPRHCLSIKVSPSE